MELTKIQRVRLFTPEERGRILDLSARGFSNREIAGRLGDKYTPRQIADHVRHIDRSARHIDGSAAQADSPAPPRPKVYAFPPRPAPYTPKRPSVDYLRKSPPASRLEKACGIVIKTLPGDYA